MNFFPQAKEFFLLHRVMRREVRFDVVSKTWLFWCHDKWCQSVYNKFQNNKKKWSLHPTTRYTWSSVPITTDTHLLATHFTPILCTSCLVYPFFSYCLPPARPMSLLYSVSVSSPARPMPIPLLLSLSRSRLIII